MAPQPDPLAQFGVYVLCVGYLFLVHLLIMQSGGYIKFVVRMMKLTVIVVAFTLVAVPFSILWVKVANPPIEFLLIGHF